MEITPRELGTLGVTQKVSYLSFIVYGLWTGEPAVVLRHACCKSNPAPEPRSWLYLAVLSFLRVYSLSVRCSYNDYSLNTYYEPTSLKAPTVDRDQTLLRISIYLPETMGKLSQAFPQADGRASCVGLLICLYAN